MCDLFLGLRFDSTDQLVHFHRYTSFYSDCSVVRLETRYDDTSRNYFIIYSHLAFFVFDRKLRIAVSHSVSNCVGILVGNVLGGKMVLVKWLFSPC